MFENEIRELFELCMRTGHETNAFVHFEIYSDAGCSVYVKDNGRDKNNKFDGAYYIYPYEELKDDSAENYKNAKEHLARLLEKGRCPV